MIYKFSYYINGSPNPDIWNVDILEANASYYALDNSITIYVGILGDSYYYDGISDEELYGGIGVCIGHEVSHAFDTNGAQFYKKNGFVECTTNVSFSKFI